MAPPPPAALMRGAAAWRHRSALFRFAASTRSHCAAVIFSRPDERVGARVVHEHVEAAEGLAHLVHEHARPRRPR